MSIPNIGAVNPNQGPQKANQSNQNLKSNIDAAAEAMKDASLIFDDEAQGASSIIANATKKQDPAQARQQAVKEQPGKEAAFAEAAAATEMTDDIKKKKRRRFEEEMEWEEKLAEMEGLEKMVDEKQVDDNEKGIVREFFKNMSTLRNLKRRLKQLEQEKKHYRMILEGNPNQMRPDEKK